MHASPRGQIRSDHACAVQQYIIYGVYSNDVVGPVAIWPRVAEMELK